MCLWRAVKDDKSICFEQNFILIPFTRRSVLLRFFLGRMQTYYHYKRNIEVWLHIILDKIYLVYPYINIYKTRIDLEELFFCFAKLPLWCHNIE